jgi:transposase InsO family protein
MMEQPIRFLSKSLNQTQSRWSTIEKEAYAIYYALTKLEDLLGGGVEFTIRTDHSNLLFLNQYGSRKVLNWKLAIQHFNCTIEHIPGKLNIPADTFSRLVPREEAITVNTILTLRCSSRQYEIIQLYHTHQFAHWGVNRTTELLIQHHPDKDEISPEKWPTLERDVKDFIKCCPTCQKMKPLQMVIRASRFTLSTSYPMTRIAIDTIGPLPDHMGFKYIIVLIDTFSRYIELFPSTAVTADEAAAALWKHSARFGAPHEIVTDMGSQFINNTLDKFAEIANFNHLKTIPYSKEENGIVERANKEVNRHIRNIMFDTEVQKDWSDYLLLTEKLLNSTTKQPTGISPNALLFGNAINTDEGLFTTFREHKSRDSPISIRDYVDKLLTNQQKLIEAAIKTQNKTNIDNLKRRYSTYKQKPKVQNKVGSQKGTRDQHNPLTTLTVTIVPQKPTNNNTHEPSVVELTMDNFIITTYNVGDYVLRRCSPSKLGNGPPVKYSSWWRGPYIVSSTLHTGDKIIYTIKNLISGKEYKVDVMHIKPYYFDPNKSINPLNIAAKDIDEYVVDHIVTHDFSNPKDKKWRVRWAGYEAEEDTWEPLEHLKDVEAFHQYCIEHKLIEYLPKHIKSSLQRKRKKTNKYNRT